MLVSQGAVISYFNDVPKEDPDFAALQFLGTKGFFDSYEAQPDAPLSCAAAYQWATLALQVTGKESIDWNYLCYGDSIPRSVYNQLMQTVAEKMGLARGELITNEDETVTRREACVLLSLLLEKAWH